MGLRLFVLPALFFLFHMTGCAGNKNLVLLVPDPDGSVGRIVVSNAGGSVEMNTAYQASTLRDKDTAPSAPRVMEKTEVESIFTEALKIQPAQPTHFLLYFGSDSVDLAPESQKVLVVILERIHENKSASVSVIGHSDTAGDKAYNLMLSNRRAKAITDLLLEKGIDKNQIETTSHGEENPLVKTGDDVSEPKNRRVEVVVR
ncbi:MAG: OmpA family protein [Syntrophaceae bacterium]|nr:OmpA family protein [Syntrophaceae bacterium]